MKKYTVEYSGTIEVDADCELEAECTAATMCRPDNCRVQHGSCYDCFLPADSCECGD